MENKLFKYVTGFCKSHGTQHSIMVMLEERKNTFVCYLWIYQKSLLQLIMIFYWQNSELMDFLIMQ